MYPRLPVELLDDILPVAAAQHTSSAAALCGTSSCTRAFALPHLYMSITLPTAEQVQRLAKSLIPTTASLVRRLWLPEIPEQYVQDALVVLAACENLEALAMPAASLARLGAFTPQKRPTSEPTSTLRRLLSLIWRNADQQDVAAANACNAAATSCTSGLILTLTDHPASADFAWYRLLCVVQEVVHSVEHPEWGNDFANSLLERVTCLQVQASSFALLPAASTKVFPNVKRLILHLDAASAIHSAPIDEVQLQTLFVIPSTPLSDHQRHALDELWESRWLRGAWVEGRVLFALTDPGSGGCPSGARKRLEETWNTPGAFEMLWEQGKRQTRVYLEDRLSTTE